MTTARRLIEVAAALLDSGGESAVTLRAVGKAAGLSHNAPYKHFENRNALLAGVAIEDLAMLTAAIRRVRSQPASPIDSLLAAIRTVTDYSQKHPARYRLLFDDPDIAAQQGELKQAAMAMFGEFVAAVRECQAAGQLPQMSDTALTGLIFATVRGLIGLQASGRMHPEKGFAGIDPSLELLVELLSRTAKVPT